MIYNNMGWWHLITMQTAKQSHGWFYQHWLQKKNEHWDQAQLEGSPRRPSSSKSESCPVYWSLSQLLQLGVHPPKAVGLIPVKAGMAEVGSLNYGVLVRWQEVHEMFSKVTIVTGLEDQKHKVPTVLVEYLGHSSREILKSQDHATVWRTHFAGGRMVNNDINTHYCINISYYGSSTTLYQWSRCIYICRRQVEVNSVE